VFDEVVDAGLIDGMAEASRAESIAIAGRLAYVGDTN
jgi:hypothetical protein